MRVRRHTVRLALVAAVAVAAGSSLAACRSEPSVAAYLGDQRISIDRVERIVRDVNAVADARLAAQARARDDRLAAMRAGKDAGEYPPMPAEAMLPVRHTSATEVLSLMICAEVARRIVAERQLTVHESPAALWSEAFALPESGAFVGLWAGYWTYEQAVVAAELARPLDDDEAGRLFDAFDAAHQVPDGTDYDQAVEALKRTVRYGPIFDAQKRIAAAMEAAGVSVNPRFSELVLPSNVNGGLLDVAFPDDSEIPVEEA